MHKIPELRPKKDLAARVFGNFYFDIAWLLFLAVAVQLVWPLRNALLVLWVYGSDAYFHQAIRVVKNKPTTFSNGAGSPELPDLVTSFGVFLVTVFGLSLLLIYALRFYEKHFGRREHEITKQVRLGPILRDVIIVTVLIAMAPGVAAVATGSPAHLPNHYTVADAVSVFMLGTIAFTISGCLSPAGRWRHLVLVAVGAWLACLFNVIFFAGSILGWILTAMLLATVMGIGGTLSYVFKKGSHPSA
jgi:hypothetical protein